MDRQQHPDLGAVAKAIIDSNLYLTLGTADDAGRPWVSPVYYASEGYTEFYWVSSPQATHSRNIAARPQISIVVERGIDVFSRGSVAHGAREWGLQDVQGPAPYRLYRATVSAHSILDPA